MRYNKFMNNLFLAVLRQWMPLAVAVSAITFIIYVSMQQDIRLGANDPQIQMAEDLATSLNSGQTASISGKIDIANSLAPFTILYDKKGKVMSSNAVLDRKTPVVPQGVLNITESINTEQQTEKRITWQPRIGVRLATVVVSYNKGYVLVGRNLRELEKREDQQLTNILFGWFISLIATLTCVYIMQTLMKGKK
jgi:hypothetical protein